MYFDSWGQIADKNGENMIKMFFDELEKNIEEKI